MPVQSDCEASDQKHKVLSICCYPGLFAAPSGKQMC